MRSIAKIAADAAVVTAVTFTAACTPPLEPTLTNIKAEIFDPRCSASVCHSGSSPGGEMDLASDPYAALVNVPADANPERIRVVPGHPEHSVLYTSLIGDDPDVDPMPKGFKAGALGEEDIELVRAWIEAGAQND